MNAGSLKQYEKMTFSELKDTSYEVDSPIPPGEFLQGNKDFYTVYLKYEDGEAVGWMVTVGKQNYKSDQQFSEKFLCDSDEVWCSEFTTMRDPNTGKEVLYAIGLKHVYKISGDANGEPIIEQKLRSDIAKEREEGINDWHSIILFQDMVIDRIEKEPDGKRSKVVQDDKAVLRVLYIVTPKDTSKPLAIYDVEDPNFQILLPFTGLQGKPILKVVRFYSSQMTHWAFLVDKTGVQPSKPRGIYAIPEIRALAKNYSSLGMDDFAISSEEPEQNGESILYDLLTETLYTDHENPGSKQLVLIKRTGDNLFTLVFKVLTINEKGVFVKVSDDAISFPYIYPEFSESIIPFAEYKFKLLRNPNGYVSVVAVGLSRSRLRIIDRFIIASYFSLSVVTFEQNVMKFRLISSADQAVMPYIHDNWSPAFNTLSNYFDFGFTFSEVDFSKKEKPDLLEVFIIAFFVPTHLNNWGATRTFKGPGIFLKLDNYTISTNQEFLITFNNINLIQNSGAFFTSPQAISGHYFIALSFYCEGSNNTYSVVSRGAILEVIGGDAPEDVVIRSILPHEIDLNTVNSIPIKVSGNHLLNADNFQFFKQSGEGSGINSLQTIELSRTDGIVQLRITTPESMIDQGRYQLRAMDTHTHDMVRYPMPFIIQ